MKLSRTSLGLTGLLCVLAISCGSASTTATPVQPDPSPGNGAGGPPAAGPAPATVTASIASVTLGDDCGDAAPATPPTAGGVAQDAPMLARCAPGADCGRMMCRQSMLQLSLTAAAGDAPATIVVQAVTLHDARNDARVVPMTPAGGQVWNAPANAYAPWDGRLMPAQSLSASYTLRGLDWSAVTTQTGFGRHDGRFRVHVVVLVNGVARELVSEEIGPEPMIVT